jgi:orotidine-5'-phosphate decarboxylase
LPAWPRGCGLERREGSGRAIDMKDKVFVALDMPDAARARTLVTGIGPAITSYKVGLELLFGGGFDVARDLKNIGKSVFLDMKLLDIPNTVEKATANIARMGVDYLTVHGVDRKTMDAAVRGRGSQPLKLLAVTVLTSLDANDLAEQGIAAHSPADLVVHRARLAQAAGFDGVIASGQEAASVRLAVGPDFFIVTPGIRPAGTDAGDQARVMTPRDAFRAGATHLVVGRPITAAKDPRAAAEAIVADCAAD